MTGDELATLLSQVQSAIATIIDNETDGIVRPRYAADSDGDRYAGLYIPDGLTLANGWSVGFAGIELTEMEGSPTGCVVPIVKYTVDYFRQFEFGTNAANSELEFRKAVAKVTLALHKSLKLSLAEVSWHSGMKTKASVGGPGANLLHRSFGEMEVTLSPISLT